MYSSSFDHYGEVSAKKMSESPGYWEKIVQILLNFQLFQNEATVDERGESGVNNYEGKYNIASIKLTNVV